MNYNDFIEKLANATGRSKAETKRSVSGTFDKLTEELGNGNGFSIPGLGTFTVEVKKSRKAYNPHYEDYILIPPKQVVSFTPSSNLKDDLKFTNSADE